MSSSQTTSLLSQSTLTPRTGEPRVLLTPSRTKLNAVHAGPSLPLALLRELTSSSQEPFFLSPSKRSSPAIPLPTDAPVDGNPTLSSTLRPNFKNSSPLTHTPQDLDNPDHANMMPPRVKLTLLLTPTSQPTLLSNSRLPSTLLQSQSPLRPTEPSSNNTPPVFWTPPLAEPNSITPSPPSDTELRVDKSTTSSETPGELHGETKDTSRSPPLTDLESAVSKCNLFTHPPPLELCFDQI